MSFSETLVFFVRNMASKHHNNMKYELKVPGTGMASNKRPVTIQQTQVKGAQGLPGQLGKAPTS